MAVLYGLSALNLGDVKTEEEQSIALAETEGGNHYAAAIRAEKLAKGKKRARRGGRPWKRRYKKRLCGRKKRNTFSVMAMHWPILTRNWP